MKTFSLLVLLSLALAYVPYPFSSIGVSKKAGDLIITGQACGCPCPQARVLEGALNIHDSILHQNPEIYRTQMNLAGNTPFEPFVYEIAVSRLLVQGEVIGIDTILCTRTGCELAPIFRVDSWETLDYVPIIHTWERWQERLYEFICILFLIFIIIRLYPFFLKVFTKLGLGA
ncbi:MAG: hypothetical protein AAF696_31810 [Bacteroidota bacterium]